jgi:hypothetical protein
MRSRLACNGGGRTFVHRTTIEAYVGTCAPQRRRAFTAASRSPTESLGMPSTNHGGILDTHACYTGCAAFVLERGSRGPSSVMLCSQVPPTGIGKAYWDLLFA